MDQLAWIDITPVPTTDEYYDMGTYSYRVTTSSPEAQIWFDRGLAWVYTFNHDEGNYCFRQAIAHDNSCIMPYWGLAYSLGPNYNKPWKRYDANDLASCVSRGHYALIKGRTLAKSKAVTDVERELLDAIMYRFEDKDAGLEKLELQNRKYADAMAIVYDKYDKNIDVASLYADSMMQLNNWDLWNLFTSQPQPYARTGQIQKVLEDTFPERPGRLGTRRPAPSLHTLHRDVTHAGEGHHARRSIAATHPPQWTCPSHADPSRCPGWRLARVYRV